MSEKLKQAAKRIIEVIDSRVSHEIHLIPPEATRAVCQAYLSQQDELAALRKLRDAVEYYLDGSGRIRISELGRICNECKPFKQKPSSG